MPLLKLTEKKIPDSIDHGPRDKRAKHDHPTPATRINGAAKPYISNATELLLTTEIGQRIFTEATQFNTNLYIGKSGVAVGAGNGLYVVAKESELLLKAGQVITWFSGKIEYYDEEDPEQGLAERYTIGLGSSIRNASQVIISNPDDDNLMGCAHFINHSTKPNCRLDYLQSINGVNAVVIRINTKTIVPKGQALELVFNYSKSAVNMHGIYGICDYIPTLKPISQLYDIEDRDGFLIATVDDTLSVESSRLPEVEMPKKSNEYTVDQMGQIAQQFLPASTFNILVDPEKDTFANLGQRPETFFFIQLHLELGQIFWILMHFDRETRVISLFDPEGLLLNKVSPQWFSNPTLASHQINLCHSWFVFSKFSGEPEYQKTGVICAELAKSIHVKARLGLTPIEALPKRARWPLEIVDCNLTSIVPVAGEDVTALTTLVVQHPERISSVPPHNRAEAIAKIVASQQLQAVSPIADVVPDVEAAQAPEIAPTAEVVPDVTMAPGAETAAAIGLVPDLDAKPQIGRQDLEALLFSLFTPPQVTHGRKRKPSEESSLKDALEYHRGSGAITIEDEDILLLISSATAEEAKKELDTLCSRVLFEDQTPQTLQQAIDEYLDKIKQAAGSAMHRC